MLPTVLLVVLEDVVILLGADLEGKGWLEILEEEQRPNDKASVFKIPHHGSEDAHVERVWTDMLQKEPIAALTPWRRGGRSLPTEDDVRRILSLTSKAYVTARKENLGRKPRRHRHRAVERTIRETGARFRSLGRSEGMIRLRKRTRSAEDWSIETLEPACHLDTFY